MSKIEIDGVIAEYQQAGDGPNLLLLHSLLTDMSVFDRVLPKLRERFRVTRLNLPGYGQSQPRPLASVADYADHLNSVFDKLHLPPETHVFGNGFGAFAALVFAIRHGARFSRLLLADVVAAFPEPAPAGVSFRGHAAFARRAGRAMIAGSSSPSRLGAHPP